MREKLKRELKFIDVFSIASGAMISSGLFVLPSLAYQKCGASVFFAYVLASLFILPAMLSKAELATAMPRAGGTYFFIDRSLGSPMGMLGGVSDWFSLSFKSSFALVGLGIFFELFIPTITYTQIRLIACAFLFFFIMLNILGVKETGKVQIGMVLVLLALLIFYVLYGFTGIEIERYSSVRPINWKILFSTAGFVFVSYGGLTKIASVAEEVENPGKTIPFAMIASWGVVGLLYAAVVFVTVGLLEPYVMGSTHTPISLGAKSFLGTPGLIILSFAGVLAFLSTANAGILSASRSPMAMARDNLLPVYLSKVNPKFQTPVYSIIFTGIFMFSAIMFLNLEHLVEVASALMILLFILVNLSVIVMRESKVSNYRPKFKSPLYPWIQIFGVLGPIFLLIEFGFFPLLITVSFLVGAFIWYGIYARPRVSRESGLIYIVQRLLSRHLSKGVLRKELREIVRERDEIVIDRLDKLIHACPILDFKEGVTMDDFFDKVSDVLNKRLKIDKKKIYRLLLERERESSTVVTPGLAIPHIVIPGANRFDILIARCRDGITFDTENFPVNTAFILIGTKDERNFHLKTLAAIAQIAQDKEFDEKWLKAGTVEELRDIILLAERKRFNAK